MTLIDVSWIFIDVWWEATLWEATVREARIWEATVWETTVWEATVCATDVGSKRVLTCLETMYRRTLGIDHVGPFHIFQIVAHVD